MGECCQKDPGQCLRGEVSEVAYRIKCSGQLPPEGSFLSCRSIHIFKNMYVVLIFKCIPTYGGEISQYQKKKKSKAIYCNYDYMLLTLLNPTGL